MAVASNIFFLQIIPQVTVVTNDLTNTLVGAAIIGAGIGFVSTMVFRPAERTSSSPTSKTSIK